jgi:predicted amidohydrolase
VDVLGFPEMSLTGYADPALYPQAVVHLDGPEVAALLEMTRGREMTVLAGLIEANPQGKPFITQIAARDGRLLGHYRKRTIKDEEAEWFSPGEEVPVFTHGSLTFGIAICADIGNTTVFADLACQGAEVVFELAAPGLHGEQETRDWQAGFEWWRNECREKLGEHARRHGCWIAVATQAGRTVDEDFPGGGHLFAPDGRRVFATPDWSPGAVFLAIDRTTGQVQERR